MPAPIVLVSNQRIQPGKVEEYKAKYAAAAERFRTDRPNTLAHSAYLSEDATQVSVVMAFLDAEAMEVHLRGLGSSPQQAQEFMQFVSLQIYGMPTAASLDLIRQMVGPDVPVTMKPEVVAGYIRLGSG